MWFSISKMLLKRAFKTKSLITVDNEKATNEIIFEIGDRE